MPTQTDLLPTAIEASAGYDLILIANIDEDPDAPDALWGISGDNVATSVRVSFPTPDGPPANSGTLILASYVRKFDGTGSPTARIDLYNNSVLIASGSGQSITSLDGQKITQNFDLAVVNGSGQLGDGSGIEMLVAGTETGGAPAVRATVNVGALDIESLPWAAFQVIPTIMMAPYVPAGWRDK